MTRQELFFFAGGAGWREAPGWVDYDRATYGTGDIDGLGVKAAWDPGSRVGAGRRPAGARATRSRG